VTITVARLVADGWALLRRERRVLVGAGAPFLFLPPFAVQLLADGPPVPMKATPEWMARAGDWAAANLHWYLLADVVVIFGTAVLALLLAARGRPTVGAALREALRMLPRFVLAALVVAVPVGLGLYLFILPGLYLQARLALVPLLVAAGERSAIGAAQESWRRTSAVQLPLWGAVVALFSVQWLAAAMLVPVDTFLRAPGHANPLVLALVDGGIAAVLSGYRLGLLLLGAAAWVRLNRGT
jgi:hypothetical protein